MFELCKSGDPQFASERRDPKYFLDNPSHRSEYIVLDKKSAKRRSEQIFFFRDKAHSKRSVGHALICLEIDNYQDRAYILRYPMNIEIYLNLAGHCLFYCARIPPVDGSGHKAVVQGQDYQGASVEHRQFHSQMAAAIHGQSQRFTYQYIVESPRVLRHMTSYRALTLSYPYPTRDSLFDSVMCSSGHCKSPGAQVDSD